MAIKKDLDNIIHRFPRNSVKTCYVSCSQLHDVREFKMNKRIKHNEGVTTPLHLACQKSNGEAARVLLMDHDYDVNILLHEKNFLYDLLQTGDDEDFKILTRAFKNHKPCINSGSKMPIN